MKARQAAGQLNTGDGTRRIACESPASSSIMECDDHRRSASTRASFVAAPTGARQGPLQRTTGRGPPRAVNARRTAEGHHSNRRETAITYSTAAAAGTCIMPSTLLRRHQLDQRPIDQIPRSLIQGAAQDDVRRPRKQRLRRIGEQHSTLVGLVRVQGRRVSSHVHAKGHAEPGDLLCGTDAVATPSPFTHKGNVWTLMWS